MSVRTRASSLVDFGVDAEDVREPGAWLGLVRYMLELVVVFGLGVRGLCYFGAAVVAETIRGEEEVVFDDSDEVTLRWAFNGPGWEYPDQSRWEIRLAGVFCLVTGYVFLRIISNFPVDDVQAFFLWSNCGVLALDLAWTELYLQITSDGG